MGLRVHGGWGRVIERVRSLIGFLIGRIVLSIHPKRGVIQNDSAYLSDLGCYMETIWLFTHYGILGRKIQSINSSTARLSVDGTRLLPMSTQC